METINTFGYWDKGKLVKIFFNNNSEIELLWMKLCTNLSEKSQVPTKYHYEEFIKENTPKYFKPKQ